MAEQFAPWGPGNMGSRIAEQDRERAALNALALQTGQQNLELARETQPAKIALQRAQAEKAQAEAKKLQLQQMALDKWLEGREAQLERGPSAQTTPEGQMQEAVGQLADLAKFQADTGDLEGSRKAYGTLSEAVARGVRASQQEALKKKTEFETRAKMMDKALGYVRGAKSQEDLRLAGDAFEMEHGARPPVFNMPYSPQNIQRALEAGLTERQARLSQHEKEMEKFRERSLGLEGARTKALRDRTDAYVARQKASTERLKKLGVDKPDLGGTEPQMKDARALLVKNHPELAEAGTELNVGAASIVSEAKSIVRNRKGTTWAAALQEAYTHQKDDIREETKGSWWGLPFTGTKTTTFNASGRTPETALALPDTPDPAKLIPGKFYTQGGVTKRWTGKGWAEDNAPAGELEQEPETP